MPAYKYKYVRYLAKKYNGQHTGDVNFAGMLNQRTAHGGRGGGSFLPAPTPSASSLSSSSSAVSSASSMVRTVRRLFKPKSEVAPEVLWAARRRFVLAVLAVLTLVFVAVVWLVNRGSEGASPSSSSSLQATALLCDDQQNRCAKVPIGKYTRSQLIDAFHLGAIDRLEVPQGTAVFIESGGMVGVEGKKAFGPGTHPCRHGHDVCRLFRQVTVTDQFVVTPRQRHEEGELVGIEVCKDGQEGCFVLPPGRHEGQLSGDVTSIRTVGAARALISYEESRAPHVLAPGQTFVPPLGSPINRINVVREEDTSLWLPWLALTDIRNGEALRKGIHSVLVPVASMRKDGHVAPVCLFEHVGTDVGKIIEYAAGIDSIWHAILLLKDPLGLVPIFAFTMDPSIGDSLKQTWLSVAYLGGADTDRTVTGQDVINAMSKVTSSASMVFLWMDSWFLAEDERTGEIKPDDRLQPAAWSPCFAHQRGQFISVVILVAVPPSPTAAEGGDRLTAEFQTPSDVDAWIAANPETARLPMTVLFKSPLLLKLRSLPVSPSADTTRPLGWASAFTSIGIPVTLTTCKLATV